MQLTYRGVTYEYNPTPVNTIATANNGEVGGKYRGLEWRFRNRKQPTAQKPTLDLIYRGVHYNTGGAIAANPQPATAPAPSVAQRARALFLNKEVAELKRQKSLLLRSEENVGLVH